MELLTRKKQTSIDLLKDEEQIESSSQKKLVITICVVILVIVGALSIGLFSFKVTQKFRLSNLKGEVNTKTTAWQALEPVGTSVKTISAKDQVVKQTNTKYGGLENKLNKIRELLPEGAAFTTLTLNAQGKTVISGKASSAAIVYQFYEVLKKEKEITLVSLDSLAKASSDYTFNISLTVTTK